MHPDNLDDLFRGKLDGHETPPGDDLWARLQAQPAAEPAPSVPQPNAADAKRLDQLFQTRLNTHISPPARELWERLEDEHLRPRKRRAAAWWPMAIAAAIALLITAGGAGLWLGFPAGKTGRGNVAVQSGKGSSTTAVTSTPNATLHASIKDASINKVAIEAAQAATDARDTQEAIAATTATNTPENTVSAPIQKNAAGRATSALASASTASKARKFAERQSPRHPLGSTRQPDVAAPSPSLVAHTTPAVAPAPDRNTAADEPRLNPAPAPVIAQTNPNPAPEIVPAGTVITVDVRNGATPAARNIRTTLSEVASAEETTERRGLGGRLLQQAGHLVRGERLSLAEATGLPENMTLKANIAGRRVSKSIQL
ncbi:hypothetical protein [Hymenobacter negativus]|uniref:Uncharacterized protein n=1 Tax=Hymenobacter negativus TaxID=2795026 RepID=A0ABS3QMT4_9BACT|nr:hypothetical protein [Hymenobacter negativus]MBO2012567.1 hypothetical protein [Hymenobacter negativus]